MTAYEVETPSALVARLRSALPSAVTIAIDGIHGAGKSMLARALHQALGGTLLSLDDFIHQNQGSFLPHLKVDELRAALTAARPLVVLEGICMLAALDRLRFTPDLLIYVKRIDRHGVWDEESTGDPTESAETIIRREAASARPFLEALGETPPADGESGLDSLREEVIRYHCDFQPFRRAEIVYLNQVAG